MAKIHKICNIEYVLVLFNIPRDSDTEQNKTQGRLILETPLCGGAGGSRGETCRA